MDTPADTRARPTSSAERLVGLDVLRGLAILGIFVVNVLYMAAPTWRTEHVPPLGDDTMGAVVWAFVTTFFEFKFITIFSLLFGAGMALQRQRARERGAPFVWPQARRLGWLAVMGALHGCLLFHGDILLTYALTGLALLAMSGFPRWLQLGGALVGFALLSGALWMFAGSDTWRDMAPAFESHAAHAETQQALQPWSETPPDLPGLVEHLDHMGEPAWTRIELAAMRPGSWAFMLRVRGLMYVSFLLIAGLVIMPRVLSTFLLGAALMRGGFFGPGGARANRVAVGLGALALVVEVVLTVLDHGTPPGDPFVIRSLAIRLVTSVLVGVGIAGAVQLRVRRGVPSAGADALAAVGRMALTHYLLQSLLGVLVFNVLGTYGRLATWELQLFVVVVFIGQCRLSRAWLARYRMGPCEWLWRWLTYGRRPAFRRAQG